MKRFLFSALMALGLAGPVGATTIAYDQFLVNGQVISSTQNFTIDMSVSPIDLLSAYVTVSTASPTSATFRDGHISSGTITVSSATFLTAQAGYDTITVTTNSALSPTYGSDSILVSSGVTGSSITVTTNQAYILRDGNQYTHVETTTGTAIAIRDAINTYVDNVTASVAGSSVIITCDQAGLFCNSYALSSTTSTALTVASAKFTGGNDNASFNLNGDVFYQGSDWFQGNTSSDTAVSIMNSITRADFTASTPTSTSVKIQCASAGSFCNGYTLTASTGALTVASTNFRYGQDRSYIVVNGTKLLSGVDYTAGASSATAANAIAAAMNANSAIAAVITSTAPLACGLTNPCGVVRSTGSINLIGNNYAWSASSGVVLSSFTLLNGTVSSYSLNGTVISLPSHGMATGMAVLYSTGSAVAISGLTNQTTYYIIAVNANSVGLASSATNALAGTYITLASTPAVGGSSFTLAPLAYSGSAIVTWQGSNDGSNWSNLSVSTVTLSSGGSATTTLYDFGAVNIKYIRANVNPPPTGGMNTTIKATGKRYGLGI